MEVLLSIGVVLMEHQYCNIDQDDKIYISFRHAKVRGGRLGLNESELCYTPHYPANSSHDDTLCSRMV